MGTEQYITLALGLGGWILAAIQFFVNRGWQKKDRIKEQRYDAYCSFMNKLDGINSSMQLDPSTSIFSLTFDFVNEIQNGTLDPAHSMADYGKRLLEQTKKKR